MKNVHIKTYGCSNNFHESEVMGGLLQEKGYAVSVENDSDVILLNVCTVKGDDSAFDHVKKACVAHADKKILVGGCVTKELRELVLKHYPDVSFFNTHNLQKVASVADKAVAGKSVVERTPDSGVRILLPKIRANPLIDILPISSGCTNYCTYCSVKQIKGGVKSYPVEQIVAQVKRSVAEGVKEIYLTSQDTAAYGADTGVLLPVLLRAILSVEGDFMVRLGMGNPNHFVKYVDDLVSVFEHPKLYKFLHIPVQSGNNRVLESMKREYTVDEYKYIVRKFKEKIPEMTIATDVICGYPTETAEEFLDTLNLIKEVPPVALNISRYKIRGHTPAATMEQVPADVKKERSRILSAAFFAVAEKESLQWLGWEGNVIVNEAGRFQTVKGRNYCYKQMLIPGTLDDFPLGSIVRVKVVEALRFDLKCELLDKKVSLRIV
jgi:threonylcarbamoyladenosine tRNA methylthiotransferase CDKAL1